MVSESIGTPLNAHDMSIGMSPFRIEQVAEIASPEFTGSSPNENGNICGETEKTRGRPRLLRRGYYQSDTRESTLKHTRDTPPFVGSPRILRSFTGKFRGRGFFEWGERHGESSRVARVDGNARDVCSFLFFRFFFFVFQGDACAEFF